MADQTVAFHEDAKQDSVTIAVRQSGNYAQPVAGGLALHPQLLPRAGIESHIAGFDSSGIRLGVHKAHHQHLARGIFLHDRRRQPFHFVKVYYHVASLQTAFDNFLPKNLAAPEAGSSPRKSGSLLHALIYYVASLQTAFDNFLPKNLAA